MEIQVRGDNIEGAIRQLKHKTQKDGIFQELKRRSGDWKPSERKKAKARLALKRLRASQRRRKRFD